MKKKYFVEFRTVRRLYISMVSTGSIWPYKPPVVQAGDARSAVFPLPNIICNVPPIQLSHRALFVLIRKKGLAFKSCTLHHKIQTIPAIFRYLHVVWEIAETASVSVQFSLFIISSRITGIYIKDIVFNYMFRYLILLDSALFTLKLNQ